MPAQCTFHWRRRTSASPTAEGLRFLVAAWLQLVLAVAVVLLCASIVVELRAHLATPLRPKQDAYGAAVYMVGALQAFFVATVACMGLYTLARSLCGMLSARRRQTFDNTLLFWYYTVAQGLAGLALVHGFPRLAT